MWYVVCPVDCKFCCTYSESGRHRKAPWLSHVLFSYVVCIYSACPCGCSRGCKLPYTCTCTCVNRINTCIHVCARKVVYMYSCWSTNAPDGMCTDIFGHVSPVCGWKASRKHMSACVHVLILGICHQFVGGRRVRMICLCVCVLIFGMCDQFVGGRRVGRI
jgi:hypothetical protein